MLSRSCARESDLNAPSAKLNHRRFRALLKKLRRKKIRQKAAQERDRLLQVEEKVPLLPCQEEQEQEEQERLTCILWEGTFSHSTFDISGTGRQLKLSCCCYSCYMHCGAFLCF